jgi:dephospho-CoA kinase
MKVLGLTGGIGMGKTTVASLLDEVGLPIIDTDVLAREVVEPGQPALAEIRAAFGPTVIDPSGRLRRKELAQIVFEDPARREQLESILHPRIRENWLAQVDRWRAEGYSASTVVIPLLFETGARPLFDFVICVACSTESQRERLSARGWTMNEIDRRIASQWRVEEKIGLADYVVWTEGDLDSDRRQIERILEAEGLSKARESEPGA